MLDLIVQEQFLAILLEDIQVSVIEQKPKNSDDDGQFAGNYLQARIGLHEKKTQVPTTKSPRCGRHRY